MTPSIQDRSELFFRFWRHHLLALLAVVVILGVTALGLMLSPPGAVRNPGNLIWWLMPVGLAIAVVLPISLRRRRFDPDSPEVRAVARDEWRVHNMNRASRTAFVAVLAAQWPLGLGLGFLPPPRAAMAMAASTLTIGLATLIALYLVFDRNPNGG